MADSPAVVGVLLAAGQAKRMAGASKVLAIFDGQPLVRRQVQRLLESKCKSVIVVTGHEADRVADAVGDLPVQVVHNAAYKNGMGSSIAAAARAAQDVAILLAFADMPDLTTKHFDQVIDAWDGDHIYRGADQTRPGHPIVFPATQLPALQALDGDQGARELVANAALVDIGSAALLDVDTPDAVRDAGGQLD